MKKCEICGDKDRGKCTIYANCLNIPMEAEEIAKAKKQKNTNKSGGRTKKPPFKRNFYSTAEIRKKLLKLNPQIRPNSKYTNPFLYEHIREWYKELGGRINNLK